MKKLRSFINLTKVFLNSLNVNLKGFIIRVRYKKKTKKTWGVKKELIGKIGNTESIYLKSLLLRKEKKEITEIKI